MLVQTSIHTRHACQGFGIIELLIALSLSSVATLVSVSLLTTLLTNWQQQAYNQQLANSALTIHSKLRHAVALSGHQAIKKAIHISGSAPVTELAIRYAIDGNSIYNTYDCTRSSIQGVRVNTWRVRTSNLGVPAELVCRAKTLDIIDSNTIGMHAYTLHHNGNIQNQHGNWQKNALSQTHAVHIDVLMQHPKDTLSKPPRATPFIWQGIGENTTANYVWLQLVLARKLDN